VEHDVDKKDFIKDIITNIIGVDNPNQVNSEINKKVEVIEEEGNLPTVRYKNFDPFQVLPHCDEVPCKLRQILTEMPKYLYTQDEIMLETYLAHLH